jgi:translation initiation factor eIF-2B subunit beta
MNSPPPNNSAKETPPLYTESEAERNALSEMVKQSEMFATRLADFITALKRKDFKNTIVMARETLDLVLDFLKRKTWHNANEMLLCLRGLGRRLIAERPVELVVGCMIRRVLFLLREEMQRCVTKYRTMISRKNDNKNKHHHHNNNDDDYNDDEDDDEEEEQDDGDGEQDNDEDEDMKQRGNFMTGMPTLRGVLADQDDMDVVAAASLIPNDQWKDLKRNMVQAVMELKGELDNVTDPIAKQAVEYLHAAENVLVYGLSASVEAFLKSAKQHGREFVVYVAETPEPIRGHEMAMRLSNLGIQTIVITDSAVFALMARVNKVIVACQAVMADGGILTDCGVNMIATAAKLHSVPVVCVTGLYKLTPLYPFSQDSFNDLLSPGAAVSYVDFPVSDVDCSIVYPQMDYVSPDKVSLFVTDTGAHAPSYVYRLLAEYYSPLDKLTEGVYDN